jgi:hypothetical protein
MALCRRDGGPLILKEKSNENQETQSEMERKEGRKTK